MSESAFKGKKILITGHNGFKGAWLSYCLLKDGAKLCGYSLPAEADQILFKSLAIQHEMHSFEGDIRDFDKLDRFIQEEKPEIVFHLAAQALVRRSYSAPRSTWETNLMGTVNLLESVRKCNNTRVCVVVSSDKCYENQEWLWGYRETDPMGGYDPYSASKGAVEIAVASWRRSFKQNAKIASARAGNVIGGGDWNEDRLVPDFIRTIQANKELVLRNPTSIRPWQHVLEPLHGYMKLAAELDSSNGSSFAEAWNFGPDSNELVTVETLARKMVDIWGKGEIKINPDTGNMHEAGLLRLDCSKAQMKLGWKSKWNFTETAEHTVKWYKSFLEGASARTLCDADINDYRNRIG